MLLDVFPPPRKIVRTALLVVHGVDPRLQDRARDLVQAARRRLPQGPRSGGGAALRDGAGRRPGPGGRPDRQGRRDRLPRRTPPAPSSTARSRDDGRPRALPKMLGRVLILSASAGAGHLRAAQAIERAFAETGGAEEVRNVDTLDYTNPMFRNLYSKAYIEMVNKTPELLGWLYDHLDKPWKHERPEARVREAEHAARS